MYTLAYIDCACSEIKSNDSPPPLSQITLTYFNTRKETRTWELHQGIASCLYTEGLVLFCNEQYN